MRVLQSLRSRKYLQRIVLSFMLVVVILVVTSVVQYFNAQSKVISMQNDADRKLLTQINYNIENMNGIVKDLAISLFNEDDMIALKSGTDFEQSILKLDKLNRLVATSPYLHSIVFYNSKQGRYYSSLNHDLDNNQLYAAISHYVESHETVPKLQLIPMELDGKEDSFDVFSFFVYDGPSVNSVSGNFLVLNIKPTWMLHNLEALNALAERENDVIFVTDSEGKVLISNDRMLPKQMDIKNSLLQRITSSGKMLDNFTYSHEDKKYKVTYLTRGLNDWQIISLQDYDRMMSNVRQLKWTAAAVTFSVVLMTVLISIYFSIRLYRPVGHLLTLIRRDGFQETNQPRDELSVIASSYSEIMDKLKDLEKDQAVQINIAKVYQLRSLITASQSISEQEFLQSREQYDIDIEPQGSLVVALVRIDNLRDVSSRTADTAMSLLYFAISNIGQELLRRRYSCEAADMKSDHLVFVISKSGGMGLDGLHEVFRDMQGTVRNYYHITFSVTLSSVFDSYRDITAHYSQDLRHANYRMIVGKQAIIDPDRVKNNEECGQFHIPQELERQLTDGIKSGDRESINDVVLKWMELVRTFSFENMFSALLHMVVTLNNTLSEMNHNKLNPVSVNLQAINRRILEMETLEEIHEVLMDAIGEVFDKRQSGRDEKSRLIADTIKEIVEKHYSDPDLNVQKIADMLRMSHTYLGQVFKEQEGATVVDFINRTRLAQAKIYLEYQDLTVTEIMEKVGFGNESYFYRLFKRQYGTTPKEYRLKSAINRNS
ncbi:helix-turn-helix domain-containing protein [Paenibacillus whitsoniae]|uniref:AraC family transcriptional regulator n=1 Tax=Paenibacillus whitsoniae TaxID=2496558 RepID=A0A3S0APD1_9BACL|nr:helix-turn-helix domain-containing protein [Paenibacillus whitsoniae]RTE09224.1 AraC family transcriptional regulator [Paenibacillus whitsoniae]